VPTKLAQSLWIGALLVGGLCSPARSDDVLDKSLQVYAVHVVRVPKENWTGQGVYLGNGLVLTAGHVAGEFWRVVRVEISGQSLPTEVLKRGQLSGTDLALLSIDDQKLPVSLRLRRMTVCNSGPKPGEEVIVATPEGIAPSHVISPARLPSKLDPKYRTAISDVATTGNSGSGVFDSWKQCLLGIISANISQNRPGPDGRSIGGSRDIAKYFVPAPVISAFMPPEYRAALAGAPVQRLDSDSCFDSLCH
jgi:S1-C subfamily serine protease